MASAREHLLELFGLRWADGERAAVPPELARIATALQRRGCRSVGLVPAAEAVGVPAVAVGLGIALAEVTGAAVGVVDASGTWPGAAADPASHRASPFSADWLTDGLALFRRRTSGTALVELDAFLHAPPREVGSLVVDLTGFARSGEHLEAMALLDGAAVVARAGSTTSRQLERSMREIPLERNLGVLLVGA
jgi:hypothetical protein